MIKGLPLRSRGQVTVIFAVAAIVMLVLGRLITVTAGPIVLHPFTALVALGGILAGPAAVIGALVGYLVIVAFHWAWNIVTIWDGIGYAIIGILSYLLWGAFGLTTSKNEKDSEVMALFGEFVAVAAGATLVTAGILALGYELIGQFRLFPPGVFTGLNQFLSIILFGGPLLVIAAKLNGDRDMFALRRSMPINRFQSRKRVVVGFLLIPLMWLFIGSVISIGYQIAEIVPTDYYIRFGLGWLLPLRNPAYVGEGGSAVQIAVGVFFFVIWFSYIYKQITW